MATTNNIKRVVKNVANTAWAGICWCGKGLITLVMGILMVLALLALFIFFLNPVMFLFWSIIRPKAAASMLYEMDFPFFEDIMQALNGWMVALYPFCMKKHFMKVRGIDKYSAKAQCRYYYQANDSVNTIKQMSDEGRRRLWSKGTDADLINIVKAGFVLTDAQFYLLVRRGLNEAINFYICRWTPSSAMISTLISLGRTDHLVNVCARYGLSADLIKMVFDQPSKEMVEAVRKALVVYSHRQIVVNTAEQDIAACAREWNVFCNEVKGGHICVEAQKMMNLRQYDVFHKAGHTLDRAAVEKFLATGNVEMCSRIFRYEKDYGRVSEIADSLVTANPKLSAALLKVMSERAA